MTLMARHHSDVLWAEYVVEANKEKDPVLRKKMLDTVPVELLKKSSDITRTLEENFKTLYGGAATGLR